MAPTPSILIQTEGPFKGGTKVTSNRLHFTGGTPADGAHWTTFSDAVVGDWTPCISSEWTVIGTVGYAAGSDVPVFSKAYTSAGGRSPSSTNPAVPAFVCALMRWETAARTTKNHPIYLFNYVHGMLAEGTSGANADKPFATIKTNLDAIGAKWIGAGYSDGTNTYKRAGPNGANGTSYTTATYLIDHDLSPR